MLQQGPSSAHVTLVPALPAPLAQAHIGPTVEQVNTPILDTADTLRHRPSEPVTIAPLENMALPPPGGGPTAPMVTTMPRVKPPPLPVKPPPLRFRSPCAAPVPTAPVNTEAPTKSGGWYTLGDGRWLQRPPSPPWPPRAQPAQAQKTKNTI